MNLFIIYFNIYCLFITDFKIYKNTSKFTSNLYIIIVLIFYRLILNLFTIENNFKFQILAKYSFAIKINFKAIYRKKFQVKSFIIDESDNNLFK